MELTTHFSQLDALSTHALLTPQMFFYKGALRSKCDYSLTDVQIIMKENVMVVR